MHAKLFLGLMIATSLVAAASHAKEPALKAVIIDGQNNHDWQATTPLLKTSRSFKVVYGRRGHVATQRGQHERV